MSDEPERVWIGLRGVNTYKADHFDTEYLRADLIDMDVLRRVEAGYSKALTEAESWIHDQLDGTGHVEDALADLDESRSALTGLRAMMEKLK